MANLERRGGRWRARVFVRGARESGTFATRAEAAAWALEREANLSGRRLPKMTLEQAFDRYARDVSPSKRGGQWEIVRLKAMQADPIARRALAALETTDIAGYRDRRLQAVSGATVRREMNLLGSVLEIARREWRWIRTNPCRDVRKPPSPASRKRRIDEDEVAGLTCAFGLEGGLKADTAMQRTGLAFLFALETAMRAGEILGLTSLDVRLRESYVRLPRTKNGDVREVPLTPRACEILRLLPDRVFALRAGTRDVLFRKACKAAKVEDLHFHDSRAEAIWRLSKKLDVLELARVIGHRDPKSLLLYYNVNAADLAKRLAV
jgi:integrase